MLVDVEDIRWRGLLGLLHRYHGGAYYSPAHFPGGGKKFSSD
jgi:hypothetical protein